MKVAIAGSRGFIGASYMKHRSDLEFVIISRSLLYGDSSLLKEALTGCEVVLNLAGSLPGIFNLSSPYPIDNATFTKTLAEFTGTRWILRIPTLFIKSGLGEAHILMTEGPKVLPARLTGEGFRFDFPTAGDALRNLVENIEESH